MTAETKAERNARIDDLFDRWLTELLTRLSEKDEEIMRLRDALKSLLDQVDQFCEVNGEADFYTGDARRALAPPAESN